MLLQLEPIVRRAGRMMLDAGKPRVHTKEGHYNFVTETDVQVQEYLRQELSVLLPGSQLLSEEQENRRLTTASTWVVDPIDGTVNYMRSRRFSCVSVALLEGRIPILAMVYDPFSDELFTARRGQGSELNGKPIHVSALPMERALITIGTTPYEKDMADTVMRIAQRMLSAGGDLRRTGSAALDLCWVACGRTELYYELNLAPWDYAAGALIAEEAGGRLMSVVDHPIDYGQPAKLLASNPLCADQAAAIIRGVLKEG